MKLIDKYLLRTLFVPLAYCLAGFVLIYIIYDLFDNLSDFIEAKTAIRNVFLFYACLIPSVLIYIVPVSLFLSVLYSLSQLTKNNELTAMRASGISLFRMMMPIAAVGLGFSVAVAAIHETIGPWSAYWTYQFVRAEKHKQDVSIHIASPLGYVNEVAGRDWMIDKFDTRTYEMQNVTVNQKRPDGSSVVTKARQARWLDGRWWFNELITQEYDRQNSPRGRTKFELHREMNDFGEMPKDFINEIKEPEFLSSTELLTFLETHRSISKDKIARVRVDLHNRLAMPWTCLIVTMIGIPFGAQTGRRGAFLGVVSAIGLFFSFYVLVNVGLALGKKQVMDPWLAGWLPNLFYFALGSIMIWRMR